LKDPGLLRNTEYVVDDIMKRLAMMDINSSNFRNELRDLIIMISDKGENIRKEVADYMSENHKMQQKIQKMKKKYKIPEELIE
ncbi:hypothetical protein ACLUW3_09795, partial [Limosilactobacillus reuteri subsp. suis]|uniref:hypothetical protein n=1 Tax=Limosilactobacillus reuteri TaxID=1598 RepID=UPI0039963C3E